MNWDAIGAFGEIVGAAAVILSLLYLAKQVQQSNRIALTSIETELQNNWSSLNESIYSDSEMAELLHKAKDSDSAFTGPELVKLEMWARRLLNAWLALESSYNNKLASEETLALLPNNIRNLVETYPGSHATWSEVLGEFPSLCDSIVFKSIQSGLKPR